MKLRSKFSLFASLLVISVVLSISILFLIIEKQHLIRETKENQITLIKGLQRVSREALLRDDDLFLINYVKTIKTGNKTVDYALFVDKGNRILAHTEMQLLRRIIKDYTGLNAQKSKTLLVQTYDKGSVKIIDVAIPVFLGKERKGTAHIGFSGTAMEKEIVKVLSKTRQRIFIVVVITLVIGLSGALLLAHTITQPIKILSKGAESIGQGNLDTKIEVKGRDELNSLAGEFNKMAQKLKELDQMKRDFVSSVTHELRSPLTAIESYVSDMLDGGLEQLKKTGIEDLSVIKNNTIRLSRFINDLLDTAKIESCRMDISCKAVDISSLIGDVATLFKFRAKEKKIDIKTNIQNNLPEVSADEDRIRQVIINLVNNSLKFTPGNGKITIAAAETNRVKGQGTGIRISVSDTGIGIPPEKLDKIFDKFEQIKETREKTDGAKGTGLGLFIVKNIVELHGGKVWVESPAEGSDKGSSFIFTLAPSYPKPTESK
jgi:signal transduction histidine kinase